MIFLTALFTQRIEALFEKIIGMSITHYDWPLDAQLLTRIVTIHSHYSERPLLNMFNAIKNTLV